VSAADLTLDELQEAPVGRIIVDKDGDQWRKIEPDHWICISPTPSGPTPSGPEPHVAVELMEFWPLRSAGTHVEQPMPTASTGPSMHDLAVREVLYRKRIGLDRYRQPLQAMNGRDAVRDTIEELADGLAYALQIREERRMLLAELVSLRDAMPAGGEVADIIDRYFPEATS